jgi:hypothetical protein
MPRLTRARHWVTWRGKRRWTRYHVTNGARTLCGQVIGPDCVRTDVPHDPTRCCTLCALLQTGATPWGRSPRLTSSHD